MGKQKTSKTKSRPAKKSGGTKKSNALPREQKYMVSRILKIDEIVRSGCYPNATTLSKKLEVSVSTIQRDMDFLRDRYDAPLEYDQVKHGYYYTDDSFFIKSVLLTEGELFAISVIQPLLEQYKNTPLEKSLENVFKKITEILPKEISVAAGMLGQEVSYVSDHLAVIDEKVFTTIFSCIKEKRTLRFEYKSVTKSEYTEREADPLHVIAHQGDWYMLAFCHNHNEIRTFSLARIKSIKKTKAAFTVPKGFDPKNHFDTTFGVWNSNSTEPPYTVELLFEPRMENYLSERRIHSSQTIARQSDGRLLVRFQSRQLKRVRNWVLSFGNAVRVLNPPELLEAVKKSIGEMGKVY